MPMIYQALVFGMMYQYSTNIRNTRTRIIYLISVLIRYYS